MTKVYLFDWGDTLMIDFPDQSGKMCDWQRVEAVEGAVETLKILSKNHAIYVATNAADSTENEIQAAFSRVGLSAFITGYFCRANLGLGKENPMFYQAIVEQLGISPDYVVMVGDSLQNDIKPALAAGIQAIWFHPAEKEMRSYKGVRQIAKLSDLCL